MGVAASKIEAKPIVNPNLEFVSYWVYRIVVIRCLVLGDKFENRKWMKMGMTPTRKRHGVIHTKSDYFSHKPGLNQQTPGIYMP